jgi:adenylate cyclase class IV
MTQKLNGVTITLKNKNKKSMSENNQKNTFYKNPCKSITTSILKKKLKIHFTKVATMVKPFSKI